MYQNRKNFGRYVLMLLLVGAVMGVLVFLFFALKNL